MKIKDRHARPAANCDAEAMKKSADFRDLTKFYGAKAADAVVKACCALGKSLSWFYTDRGEEEVSRWIKKNLGFDYQDRLTDASKGTDFAFMTSGKKGTKDRGLSVADGYDGYGESKKFGVCAKPRPERKHLRKGRPFHEEAEEGEGDSEYTVYVRTEFTNYYTVKAASKEEAIKKAEDMAYDDVAHQDEGECQGWEWTGSIQSTFVD